MVAHREGTTERRILSCDGELGGNRTVLNGNSPGNAPRNAWVTARLVVVTERLMDQWPSHRGGCRVWVGGCGGGGGFVVNGSCAVNVVEVTLVVDVAVSQMISEEDEGRRSPGLQALLVLGRGIDDHIHGRSGAVDNFDGGYIFKKS